MFGIADCNNFYCSCERVFHPELVHVPVVVLSNNDGCVIARSEESKSLGIKMGDPFYQVKDVLEKNHVAVFSSNYNLYGSLSARVMSILSRYTSRLDVYSIDEAFLDLSGIGSMEETKVIGERISAEVYKHVGIPVSVGVAPTKTLAKMASKFAKKFRGYNGCCLIDTDEKRQKALSLFPVGDVWGIGHRTARSLEYHGIRTAADFALKSEGWVRANYNMPIVRTWMELNGKSCISIEELPQKQSICTSRSFADSGVTDQNILEEAVANFASICAAKLRKQHSCCQSVMVFAHTSRFREDVPSSFIQKSIVLPVPTQSSQEIVGIAVEALRSALPVSDTFRMDHPVVPHAYKKAGVVLWNITPERPLRQDLFDNIDRKKQAALTKAIDEINRRNGHNTVRMAIQGTDMRFGLKSEHLSRQYTTNINEIIVAKAK